MDASHPTDRSLSAYALGKLDDASTDAVDRHLEQCPDCRRRVAEMSSDSFLDRVRNAQKVAGPFQTGASPARKAAVPPARDTLPPGLAEHSDFEIKQELGRGGMGVVYLAHNRLMGRDEVLKVMSKHLMDRPGVLDRFLREIRAVARLRHPNIVAAYSATRIGENIVFAMEYVEGLDLAKLIKAKGPLPVAHACNFVYQAALGLQHAHEEGLVHRDIKPANLMLSRKADRATVKVLDFGLAKLAREEKVDGGLTSQGQALGTPDFIAPEQILNAPDVDIRADIYSLGGTLFYLLTGRPPFEADSLYDVYQAHISRDADPLNLVRPDVPAGLAALVAKMMAKDPARRFQTPGEMAEALAPCFKKTNAALQATRADLSGRVPGDSARPRPRSVPDRQPQPSHAADAARAPRVRKATPVATDPPPRPRPSKARPWSHPLVVAGIACALIAIALGFSAVAVFRVRRADGVLVVQVNEPYPDLYVDGERVTAIWQNGGLKAEVEVKPGTRRVELKKDGFRAFGDEVTLEHQGCTVLVARLEPSPSATPPPRAPAVNSPPPATPMPAPVADEGPPKTETPGSEGTQGASRVPANPIVAADEGGLAGDVRDDNALKLKLCWCPTGTTPGFWMGKYEVTQSEWARLMGSMPSHALEKGEGDRYPIYHVNHGEAMAFCRKLTDLERNAGRLPSGWAYRLPTEAQWEYACRAGTKTATAFGDSLSSTQANFNGDWPHNGGQKGPNLWTAAEVGSYRPNAWGLCDMHGNVGEFTERPGVIRGGSWYDSGRNCCSEVFIPVPPNMSGENVGFRVARVPTEEPKGTTPANDLGQRRETK